MRVFLFRPEADASRSAELLRERGHEPLAAPLFTIVAGDDPAPEGEFDALVLTSANAVPALAGGPAAWRALPAYCVGARTAAAAREAGLTAHSADGDRFALAELVEKAFTAPARLLLAAGRDRHADLSERLTAAGHAVTTWTAYAAEPLPALPEAAAQALRDGGADAALHYSPRGAETFLRLAAEAGVGAQALALPHAVLSADVAAPLRAAGAAVVMVAQRPDEEALLETLAELPARAAAGDGAREDDAGAAPMAAPGGEAMSADGTETQRGRRSRAKRTPPTIELAAEAVTEPVEAGRAQEEAAEAVLPTEALPQEFDPPPPPPPDSDGTPPRAAEKQPSRLPGLLAAGLLGGVVGAGLALLGARMTAGDETANRVADLGQRVQALQAAQQGFAPRAALEAADQRAAAAERAAAEAAGIGQRNAARIAELAGQPPRAAAGGEAPSLAGIEERLGGVAGVAEAAQAAGKDLGGRLDALTTRLDAAEQEARRNALPAQQALAAARLVLSGRIAAALAAGTPFPNDVAALRSGGLGDDRLAPLAAVAAKGAATQSALLAQLRGHKAMFVRETTPAAGDWQSKLLALASRVVTVRPVDDSGDNDPATLPIRLEAALARGDVGTAAALWAQLPEPARRGSAAFGAALEARAAAQAANARIGQDAVAALGAAG